MNLSVPLFKTGQEATGTKRDQYIVSMHPWGPRTRSWGDSQDKARPVSEGPSVALSQDGKNFPGLEHKMSPEARSPSLMERFDRS